jgi:anaerobic selenocysteine-containing dehydrogenase
LCPKGEASAQFHNGAEHRLLNSLKRLDDNTFEPVAANAAMDEIAAKLTALVAQHGPRSVALFHGTGAFRTVLGNAFEKSWLAALGTPNLFSTMTINQSAKWVTMLRMGYMASGKPDLADTDIVLIAGNNPMVSHQAYPFAAGYSGAPARFFARARKNGTRFIVVDPRQTETARFADLLIQPIPGEDATLFAGLAHVLLDKNWINQKFCDRFISQIDTLREELAPYTPDYVAARVGVPVEQIMEAAQLLASAKRAFVGSATGPSMSAHSNLADHMIETVNALLGGYRRAGDLVRNPGTFKQRIVSERVVPSNRTWERGVKCHSEDIGRMFSEFPAALLPKEITTQGPDKIRALVVFAGNPAMALGDPDKTVEELRDLELLILLDPRMTETAKLAHYVIATSQPFERHDLTLKSDTLFPEPFAQYAAPVIRRPEGTIDDWEFFWGIAARMGLQLEFKFVTYGIEFDCIPDGLRLDMANRPDPEVLIRWLCNQSAVSFEELKANPGGVRTKTDAQTVQPADDDGSRLQVCPPDIAAELRSMFDEEHDHRYAYRLIVRRLLDTMNSAYRDSERTRQRYPVNWAYMNPEDMADEQFVNDMTIEIQSEHGRILGVVKAEPGLRRGVISMSHMFGNLEQSIDPLQQRGSHTGRLTSLDYHLQSINFMPRFSGVPVNLKKRA